MTRRISLAVLTATVGLLACVSLAQAEVRVSPNFKLDSDSNPFRGRDQPGIAVNPNNPQHVVAVNANYLELYCEASASFDGGITWTPAVPLLYPEPAAGQSPFAPACRSHQSVEFGTGQNVYTTAPAARTTNSIADSSTLVYKSDDGGRTWGRGVVAMEGGPGAPTNPPPGPSYTSPRLVVHAGAGSSPTGAARDRIYVTALRIAQVGFGTPVCPPWPPSTPPTPPTTSCQDASVVVSNDGGETFSDPVNANPSGTAQRVTDSPSPVVNKDGSLTVLWRTVGTTGLIKARRSPGFANATGVSWGDPVDVATVLNTGNSGTTHTVPGSPSSSATYPRVAVDKNNGNLYLVYLQGSNGPTEPAGGFKGADHFISFDSAVWFQRSTDFGATWSPPKLISDRTKHPGSEWVQTRHPSVSVSPNGRVNIVWHDRRHWFHGPGDRACTHSHIYCEDIRLGDTYLSYSTNANAASSASIVFSDNIRVTDRSHNNDVGYDTRAASGYWSWGPQAVTVGSDQQLLVAWMDSREGNWDTDTEDIYLARVNFDPSGPAPRTHVNEPDVVSRAVALSKVAYRGGTEGALVGGARDPANAGLPTCTTPQTVPCIQFGPASRNASSVVIVNENDVAGAMAGSVLARAFPGPVLLSPASGLPASVRAEIARMRPAQAFVIGDETKLSGQVATDVGVASGLLGTVVRVSGATDAATAAQIAARLDPRTPEEQSADVPAFDAAVIANPASPDAAAAVGLAAARRLPLLYVGSGDAIPSETTDALQSLDLKKVLVVGGPGVVSPGVVAQLRAMAKLADGVERLGGDNQYETSRAVVEESKRRGLPSNVVYVADGSEPMDATLLGGVVARATGILMLAPSPLHSTAAGQASSFGLSGISRFIILGPSAAPPAGDTPPPAGDDTPPPAGGNTPPAGGNTPPAGGNTPPPAGPGTARLIVRLSGPTRTRLNVPVRVTVSCSSQCTAVARASVKVPKVGRAKSKTFTLRRATARIANGGRRTVSFRLSRAARTAVGRAVRARKRVSAKLRIDVSGAGDTQTLTRTVRFTR